VATALGPNPSWSRTAIQIEFCPVFGTELALQSTMITVSKITTVANVPDRKRCGVSVHYVRDVEHTMSNT
jgi:hypothetical protein